MLRRLDDWSKQLDPELLRAAFSPGQVAIIAVWVLGLVAVDALSPGVRAFLELRGGALLAATGPVMLLLLALSFAWVRGTLARRAAPIALLVGTWCVAFVAAALVVFASDRAAPVFGAMIVTTAMVHGYQARSTLQHPFVAIADALAFAIAATLATSSTQLVVLSITGPAGVVGGMMLGWATVRSERLRAQREHLREALEAQLARERARRADEVRGILVDAQARAHDVRNALMGALSALESAAAGYRVSADTERELDRARVALRSAIDITRPTLSSSPSREPVALEPVLQRTLELVGGRFRHVDLAIVPNGREHVSVEVDGGATSLERMLSNLLVNACEGDGARSAARVRVIVEEMVDPAMSIVCVEDDGPGFAKDHLDAPITGFRSTKPEGTGLGLFTVDRLAGASGGWIERHNARTGGAVVRLVLPRASGASA
ncbi:ATP-binding protein [Sandaracinus amylolyticus]|uniref:histidine kinase n=1 Tax=Sandaracinus amylolyticus TaxID=927083 RepID=A0A0F6SG71_9BACT|nr:HAMP domain-containing sensor histidine kinase [Sandaracinus amylolyticus]AKF08184.1 sensor histidine kinase [Sandaracinus amylolyticus]